MTKPLAKQKCYSQRAQSKYRIVAACNAPNLEKRKFLFFTLSYFWLDTQAYCKTREYIALLRTHDELPRSEYHLKFCYKTFLVDLSQTKEEIFAAFDATGARYKIRKALRSGVIVNQAKTFAEKMQFYEFYQAFVEDPIRKNKILVLQKSELSRLHIFYALSEKGEFLGGVGSAPIPRWQIFIIQIRRFAAQVLRE